METLHGDAQNFGGRKKRQYTEFVNRPNSVNGLNGFELGLNGLNGLNGLRLPGLRPVLWGPLIPTRLRRGWTCFAGPALATPDEHRLYAGPDELDMIEASSFFVTCEHSSKFYALRGLCTMEVWTRIRYCYWRALFFVTAASGWRRKSACLLRKELVDRQTDARRITVGQS